RTTRRSTDTAIASSAASTNSSTSAASPRATIGEPSTSWPSSISPQLCSGCAECRFSLELFLRDAALGRAAVGRAGPFGAVVAGLGRVDRRGAGLEAPPLAQHLGLDGRGAGGRGLRRNGPRAGDRDRQAGRFGGDRRLAVGAFGRG